MTPPHADVRHKIRLRFRKDGDLRFVSHHDLMRCLERTLRRACVPFRSTAGFHPQPRMVFALSLTLGAVGAEEVLELELAEELAPDEVLSRLSFHAPPGLTFLSARVVPFKQSAQVRRAVYAVELPADRAENARAGAAELLASAEAWSERAKPSPRRVNVRPYIRDIRFNESNIEFDVWVTPNGTARIDELLGLLGLRDLLAAGAGVTRAALEVTDELSPDALASGPDPDRFRGLSTPLGRARGAAAPEDDTPPAWGSAPDGPVVE